MNLNDRLKSFFGVFLLLALFFFSIENGFSVPPPDPDPDECFPIDTCVPIDGGIGFLIAAGIAYGARMLRQKSKSGNR